MLRDRDRGWRRFLIAAALCLPPIAHPATVRAQSSALSPPPPPANQTPALEAQPTVNFYLAIPLPQVADKADQLDRKLADISAYLASGRGIIDQNQVIAGEASEIRDRAQHVDSFLAASPDILQLRDEAVFWSGLDAQSGGLRKQLAVRATELQSQIGQLNGEETRWLATQSQIVDDSGIEVVSTRVQQELDAIRNLRSQAQDQLNRALTLQNQLSLTSRRISESLAKLNDAEDEYRGHLFRRDSEPLWNLRAIRHADQPLEVLLRRSGARDYQSAEEFLRAATFGLLSIPLLFVLGLFGAFRLRRYAEGATLSAASQAALAVLAKPYSLALSVTLLVCIPEAGTAPSSIAILLYLIWIGVIFRLTPLLIPDEFRPIVYGLLTLNAVEFLRVGIPLPAMVNRIFFTLILFAAVGMFAWLGRPFRLSQLRLSKLHLQLATGIAVAGGLLTGIALVANVCGFASLARVLGVGTLLSGLYAAGLYCYARVFLLLLALFVESQWSSAFSAEIRQNIEIWGRRGILAIAILFWCTRSQLYVYLFRDSLAEVGFGILDFTFVLGKVEFSIGNILGVILILGIGFLLAKVTSSLLRSLLVAKLPIQRGLPYAISKFVYYALILLVLFAAISKAGVELNKFTVITGALGVGVGFGLQNIVNNFASGLILLFERPIRVGDTVEVNGLIGSVARIGARSSTITTAQGAEVIVPNNNLIANQVVNWTLSSPWRRVEIPVGVAYGSDPEAILKLLVQVAATNPEVMAEPPPVAFFLGFGDSALNFELRFWAHRQDTWFQLKSDVAIAVAHALRQANIEIPFPQRDIHVRGADVSIAKAKAESN